MKSERHKMLEIAMRYLDRLFNGNDKTIEKSTGIVLLTFSFTDEDGNHCGDDNGTIITNGIEREHIVGIMEAMLERLKADDILFRRH
jgi:hypothetical protein